MIFPVEEEWRAVVGYEGFYEVSSLGRIRRNGGRPWRGQNIRMINPAKGTTGYLVTSLSRPRTPQKCTSVHAIVACAFLGPRPTECHINHLDGDKTNNRPENLQYCTRSENMRHAIDVLRRKIGYRPKHTEQLAHTVKSLFATGLKEREIAAQLGIPRSTVHHLRKSRAWAHVITSTPSMPRPPRILRGENHPCVKLTADDVVAIKEMRARGAKLKEISARYKIGMSQASRIARGKSWN